MRGKFISFEGPEGSGKSTQIALLAARLRKMGVTVLLVREPGGTRMGEAIRKILQHGAAGDHIVPEAETCLFAASRAHLTRTVIIPALKSGTWVLCDRFVDSTVAYQGYGRGQDLGTIRRLNAFVTGGTVPDATVYLDLDVRKGLRRLSGRKSSTKGLDRFEREKLAFHRKVRMGYRELARQSNGRFCVVDAERSVKEIEEDIWRCLGRTLEWRVGFRAKRAGKRGGTSDT